MRQNRSGGLAFSIVWYILLSIHYRNAGERLDSQRHIVTDVFKFIINSKSGKIKLSYLHGRSADVQSNLELG